MRTIMIKLSELESVMIKELSSRKGYRGDFSKTIRSLIEEEYKRIFKH